MQYRPCNVLDRAAVLQAIAEQPMSTMELQLKFKTTNAKIVSLMQNMRKINLVHSYKIDKKWVWTTADTPKPAFVFTESVESNPLKYLSNTLNNWARQTLDCKT
jgi:hypothetical protein